MQVPLPLTLGSDLSGLVEEIGQRSDVSTAFYLVDVTTSRLNRITDLIDQHQLSTQVGSVLPLGEVQIAHQMLEGAPHKRGKIVLSVK